MGHFWSEHVRFFFVVGDGLALDDSVIHFSSTSPNWQAVYQSFIHTHFYTCRKLFVCLENKLYIYECGTPPHFVAIRFISIFYKSEREKRINLRSYKMNACSSVEAKKRQIMGRNKKIQSKKKKIRYIVGSHTYIYFHNDLAHLYKHQTYYFITLWLHTINIFSFLLSYWVDVWTYLYKCIWAHVTFQRDTANFYAYNFT